MGVAGARVCRLSALRCSRLKLENRRGVRLEPPRSLQDDTIDNAFVRA